MPKFRGMYYEVRGSGRAIILMHGWGASSSCWAGVSQELANDFTVYSVDFLGFGQSETPKRALCVGDYAEIMRAFITEVVHSPVSIVGHSFGGRVALVLANSCSFVEKVVLVDSAGLCPRFNLQKYCAERKFKRLKNAVREGKVSASVLESFGSADYRALNGVMRETFVRVVNQDLSGYAAKITAPTLILWGRADKETPVYMAKRLRKMIKRSKLIVLNGGHYVFLDSEREFNRALYEFLG